ncbi:MAG: radical SAM protein [Acidimicrobiales bacterium]
MSATPVAVQLRDRRPTRPVRLALVRPPVIALPGSLATHGPVPPVGLAYLAAVARDAGHEVTVIDAPMAEVGRYEQIDSPIGPLDRTGLAPAEVVDRLPADVEVIGITNMFLHEWPQVREIAELAKARHPGALVVVGGETPTSYWEQILAETDAVDACVVGEGEGTLLDLLDQVADGVEVPTGPSVVHRPGLLPDEGAPALPRRIRDLQEVPRPAWDLFPLDHYWADSPYFGVDLGRSMPVLATRGCPYKCTFCSSPSMWTTRYTVRDPADLADEIAGYVERHGVRNINFCDLTAITKRQWTLRFCDELDARGLDITWQLPVGTRSEALDAEVLQRLWDTGCRNITYAPESGSARMLRIMDKRVDLDHMRSSLRAAHRIGLHTHVNIIIGHPEERWTDVLASMRLLLQAAWIGCDDAAPSIFAPYPGSQDFASLLAAGRISIDERTPYLSFSRSTAASQSYNPRISARQLRVVQLAMLALFYGVSGLLHPSRLWRLARTPFRGGERTYLEQMLRTRRQVAARRRRAARSLAQPARVP